MSDEVARDGVAPECDCSLRWDAPKGGGKDPARCSLGHSIPGPPEDRTPVRVEDLPPWPCCGAHGHHAPGCDGCVCPPCPGRGNDGHGLSHCAECCMGTGVEVDLDCPVHGWAAVRG